MRINYINTIWIVTLLACPSALCRLVLLLWLVRRDGVVNLLQLPQVNVASCFFCYSRCYGNEKTILKDSVPVNLHILLITGQPSYEDCSLLAGHQLSYEDCSLLAGHQASCEEN